MGLDPVAHLPHSCPGGSTTGEAKATDRSAHKRLLADFLAAIATCPLEGLAGVLNKYAHEDATWEIFHPFNTLKGLDEVCQSFWAPLKRSFPDLEVRQHFALAGEYDGEEWVSTLGHVMGSFEAAWIGIPATHQVCYLRLGLNAVVEDGKIARVYVLLDIVDVMRQAGYYPFREMPGSPELWPAPPCSSGADLYGYDPELGLRTLTVAREMQEGLAPPAKDLAEHRAKAVHSPHWHRNMNWYGPAGVGSCRGRRQHTEYHGRLFIQAFPDRFGGSHNTQWPESGPGHYIRIGDGHFAVTGGWPSLRGTHTGSGWLGMPPTGRTVDMRVADWYRTDHDHLLVDNWVMIDTLHILGQVGHDVLDDMRFIVNRLTPS